jgi:hypothetical protein
VSNVQASTEPSVAESEVPAAESEVLALDWLDGAELSVGWAAAGLPGDEPPPHATNPNIAAAPTTMRSRRPLPERILRDALIMR